MTTVAFKDGILAADTLVTAGGQRDGYMKKAAVLKDGTLAAHSGTATYWGKFLAWDAGGRVGDCPVVGISEKEDCTNVLEVLPSGRLRMWSNSGSWEFEPVEGVYGIGSGGEYAVGAMAMGATAEEAVRLAMRFDSRTGGEITVLRHG